MVNAVELKEGIVVNIKGNSCLILDVESDIEWGDEVYSLDLTVRKISCPCGGNLEKLGRVRGQYKCLKCGKPVFLDENGEIEKHSTSNKNKGSLSDDIIRITRKMEKKYEIKPVEQGN